MKNSTVFIKFQNHLTLHENHIQFLSELIMHVTLGEKLTFTYCLEARIL